MLGERDAQAILQSLGTLQSKQFQPELAVKLIDKNPYSAPYWFGLARCYFEQQLFDKAIEACDYAIVSDEEFADAYITFRIGNRNSRWTKCIL